MDSKNDAPISSLSELGATIRSARRRKKLSQAALGERAGLSRMPVYRLEAGKDISLASLLAMLAPLGLTLSLDPRESGPLRAADLARAFAHLQEPDET
ncbi:helix-turn-helix domain-containing protein [Variovorax saccharolyticus]|uniref:helix-turn-helix domain-containing protein n=1 Tax=Variovorax saccharolyticus TaxID=3053516 RepID=UPI002576CC7F|nr:helix-turn-helix domain-containing protein [Variovorax sp. J31P216]MDM0027667.1 helix-turn-helix domain-containing protein [Variovorax sp. J31P216]